MHTMRQNKLSNPQKKQVAALDFSPDGNLVLAMAGSEGQCLSIWDWRRGERLATAKAEHLHLSANCVRFNPCLFLQGPTAEATGLGPHGAACYTLVSCGERHVRFWTLTRDRSPRLGGAGTGTGAGDWDGGSATEGAGAGAGAGNGFDDTGWEWNLTSRPGNFGVRGEVDSMTCLTFIGEPREGRDERQRRRLAAGYDVTRMPLPMARVITGAENGQVRNGDHRRGDPSRSSVLLAKRQGNEPRSLRSTRGCRGAHTLRGDRAHVHKL